MRRGAGGRARAGRGKHAMCIHFCFLLLYVHCFYDDVYGFQDDVYSVRDDGAVHRRRENVGCDARW